MIHLTLPNGNSYKIKEENTREVYDRIASYLSPLYATGKTNTFTKSQHLIASDAEGWCELACIGETYEDPRYPGIKIEITD